MGILENAKPAIVICTRNRARATAFYRGTLGWTLAYEDQFAAVFKVAEPLCSFRPFPIGYRTSTQFSVSA